MEFRVHLQADNEQKIFQNQMKPEPEASYLINQRRSANYKPNIWKNDFLDQSLISKYDGDEYRKLSEKLIEEVKIYISAETMDLVAKLELIDSWADFCKALLVEAEWYNKSQTPILEEYLRNGCISSSVSELLVHTFFSTIHEGTREMADFLPKNEDLLYNISLIVCLTNDLGTSAVFFFYLHSFFTIGRN
ncbi:hypothetical protein DVH24_017077 [Malus domestica]|uniref:Terpene synthase metal-binding domain-containing protein n=1 Tax=Malus domestica TaxID=3750 RepID=A0A498IV81_MALDO|nr:hypothetical protein DVH24_017077 [Malus domestica]